MKKCFLLVVILCLGLSTAFAQVSSTQGSIDGHVVDPAGAAVAGAKVTVTGPRTPIEVTTNEEGYFQVRNLDPGNYSLTVEQAGFKKTSIERIEVLVGRTNTVTAALEVGGIGETVNVTDVAQIDQSSTAVSANLNDQLYENIPVQRSVSSLFYLSASASDSLAGGRDNPAIAGASALDNLYIADGVNITDPSFGGIGTFSRTYGPLGTGINTSFIKEVQVKSGGFEPQYGQSQGGIVNIITKSGGNEYHGAIYGYAKPDQLEAARRQRDEFSVNKLGNLLAREEYDVGADFGGYIPGAKDHLFFFGSFNPTIRRDIVLGAHRNTLQLEQGTGRDSGIFGLLGEHVQRYRSLNYALKLDWNINANHTLAFSIFGDPSKTNISSFRTLNTDVLTALSALDYGTRNIALRYNGAFGQSNPATLSVTFSRGDSRFNETGFADVYNIVNRTQPARGNFTAQGLGFYEPTNGKNYRFTIDGTKQANFLGTHTFGLGYQFQDSFYNGFRDRSGPTINIPAYAALPDAAVGLPWGPQFSLRTTSNSFFPFLNIPGVGFRRVFFRSDRGELGNADFETEARYHAAYAQDTWRLNKYITAIVGLRWEQEQVIGTILDAQQAVTINELFAFNNPNLSAGFRPSYTFTGQWSPRIGVTVDPRGRGKTKIYYNYGRYHEYLPLDVAERSLSIEQDFFGSNHRPVSAPCSGPGLPAGAQCAVLNELGNPIPDLSLEGYFSGGGFSINDPSAVVNPGTKLGFTDEHMIGFEQQLPRNFVLSVRYQDRRIKRIIEDAAILSPEAGQTSILGVFASLPINQVYFLGNVNSTLDAGTNLQPFVFDPIFDIHGLIANTPAGCAQDADGQPLYFNIPLETIQFFGGQAAEFLPIPSSAVCWAQTGIDPATGNAINRPDGIPDGFVDPVRVYKAVEIEVNKRFSDNWQLLSNVRFATLRGNFEGHLRNDNGQTDPGISSLFDFTAGDFNLLGTQFAVGPLPTDRRVNANIFGSYTFGKEGWGSRFHGMTLGATLHGESGVPISEFLAHSVYLNAGEIPVGGRGKLGRTSPFYRLDLHVDYPWAISETARLSFIADFFNVTNNRGIRTVQQFRESTAGQLNPDFFAPSTFYAPFNLRVGLRFEF
ncbi:MAG TPA: carboxypeptidase regulatory-like domain-containing protein [Pyrinomonadaceae bacterium]|jgi:hypothetical protein